MGWLAMAALASRTEPVGSGSWSSVCARSAGGVAEARWLTTTQLTATGRAAAVAGAECHEIAWTAEEAAGVAWRTRLFDACAQPVMSTAATTHASALSFPS